MRRYFILFLLILSACAPALKVTPYEYPDPFEFVTVNSLPGNSKDELYLRAHSWMARTFVSSKDVIQMSDKDAGRIIGKAIMTLRWSNGRRDYVRYVITIDVLPGKSRLRLTAFYHDDSDVFFYDKKLLVPVYGDLSRKTVKVSGVDHSTYLYRIKNAVSDKAKLLVSDFQKAMEIDDRQF